MLCDILFFIKLNRPKFDSFHSKPITLNCQSIRAICQNSVKNSSPKACTSTCQSKFRAA